VAELDGNALNAVDFDNCHAALPDGPGGEGHTVQPTDRATAAHTGRYLAVCAGHGVQSQFCGVGLVLQRGLRALALRRCSLNPPAQTCARRRSGCRRNSTVYFAIRPAIHLAGHIDATVKRDIERQAGAPALVAVQAFIDGGIDGGPLPDRRAHGQTKPLQAVSIPARLTQVARPPIDGPPQHATHAGQPAFARSL